jgi:hypothetical protein
MVFLDLRAVGNWHIPAAKVDHPRPERHVQIK